MKLEDVLKGIGITADGAYISVKDLDLLSGSVGMDCDDGYRLCIDGEVTGPIHLCSLSAVRDGLMKALTDIYMMSVEERVICFNQPDAIKVSFAYILRHYSGDELLAIHARYQEYKRNDEKRIEDAKELLRKHGYDISFVGKEEPNETVQGAYIGHGESVHDIKRWIVMDYGHCHFYHCSCAVACIWSSWRLLDYLRRQTYSVRVDPPDRSRPFLRYFGGMHGSR